MLEINGNYGEGGGQIVRTALALSALTGKPFHAHDVRKGRKDGGLKSQHLHAVKGLEFLCDAKAEGVFLGSPELTFSPGRIVGKNINIDVGTAGSVWLLLQALLMPCCFADDKVKLTITGGTDGKWAVPWDYFTNVYLPVIRPFCKSIDAELVRRGYFPKGGGKVILKVDPKYKLSEFKDFDDLRRYVVGSGPKLELVERGILNGVYGLSHASNALEKAEVADRQASTARRILSRLDCPIKVEKAYYDTLCPGSGIVLYADYGNSRLGADSLGERGKRSESVGEEAANNLLKEISSGAPVDSHLADNLIPWLIFGGKIRVSEITEHTRTNIWVVEQFFGKLFDVKDNLISVNAKT